MFHLSPLFNLYLTMLTPAHYHLEGLMDFSAQQQPVFTDADECARVIACFLPYCRPFEAIETMISSCCLQKQYNCLVLVGLMFK